MEKESVMKKSSASSMLKWSEGYFFLLLIVSLIFSHCSPTKKIYNEAPPQERISKSVEVKRTLPLKTTDSLKYLIKHKKTSLA